MQRVAPKNSPIYRQCETMFRLIQARADLANLEVRNAQLRIFMTVPQLPGLDRGSCEKRKTIGFVRYNVTPWKLPTLALIMPRLFLMDATAEEIAKPTPPIPTARLLEVVQEQKTTPRDYGNETEKRIFAVLLHEAVHLVQGRHIIQKALNRANPGHDYHFYAICCNMAAAFEIEPPTDMYDAETWPIRNHWHALKPFATTELSTEVTAAAMRMPLRELEAVCEKIRGEKNVAEVKS